MLTQSLRQISKKLSSSLFSPQNLALASINSQNQRSFAKEAFSKNEVETKNFHVDAEKTDYYWSSIEKSMSRIPEGEGRFLENTKTFFDQGAKETGMALDKIDWIFAADQTVKMTLPFRN